MSMRTPLGRVRGLGSSRSGTEHFWLERITSVALLPLVLLFVAVVVCLQGSGYEATVATLGNPIIAVGMLIAVAVTVIHMKIGMQVVIEDYIHTELTKIVLLMLNSFFSYAVGFAAAFALLKIAFGS